ncbi:MAG: zinc-dependent alcohol dehydrogenase family protein [Chloroflexota bacterium]
MKSLRLYAAAPIETNPLILENMSNPQPGAGQIRIKVTACGVCHTDLHTVEGDIHPSHLPITPGHQVVGTIDSIFFDHADFSQKNSSKLAIGQRVGVPWLYSKCGICRFCLAGNENLCSQARFTGFDVDGGFAEYMIAEANQVLPIPAYFSDEQAAPLLCAGIIGYRSLQKADVQPGEKVALFGFGASAHICIQILQYWGCEVYVFTRSKKHQDHARSLGAVWAGDAGSNPGAIPDRAVIFAPNGDLVIRALECIRPGGTVAINAIHMSSIPTFPYQLIYGERTLRSVANATYLDGLEFLKLAYKAGIQSTVNMYPLVDANRALYDLKNSKFNGEAVLMVH